MRCWTINSIYFKNFLFTAGLVIVSFLILGTAFLFVGRSVLGSTRRATMTEVTEELARNVRQYAPESADAASLPKIENMNAMIRAVAHASGYQLLLLDLDGTVLACSEQPDECRHIGAAAPQSLLLTAGRGSAQRSVATDLDGLLAEKSYVIAAPVVREGSSEPFCYVAAVSVGGAFSNAFLSFTHMFFLISLLVLALAVLMSFLASRRMARPINDMAAASRRFAHGDFSARVEIGDREDEIGALTESFNAMAESLERSEVRRRDFISNVSHELRTPMTTIAGFADGILDGTIPRENQDQYLQTISAETKRLSRLVRRMLELAQLQDADKTALLSQTFDMRELLTRTLLSFENKINERQLDAEVDIPEESVFVRGDEDAIEQVVYNLLENAIKFSDPGTALGLSLRTQGDKARISVRNHGETIPEEERSRIFERFHKTDRSRSKDRDGVGLGLYIVKAIVNRHDEDIAVTSADGVTEFSFTLALRDRERSRTRE